MIGIKAPNMTAARVSVMKAAPSMAGSASYGNRKKPNPSKVGKIRVSPKVSGI